MVAYAAIVAGQDVTADDINGLIQVTMPWTDLASLGAYGSGFGPGAPAPRMQKVWYAGTEKWEFEGRISVSGLTAGAGGIATCFTFNVGFQPGSERGFMPYATSANLYAMFTAFKSNGQLQIGLPTAGGNSSTSVSLDGLVITNPLR